ncbi:hypothetical protein DFP72DRAFT_847309 [Ephemerocybe angulata]|uniref:Uncharacterized protein n=1 Tax=Ephemerocybe angulata TaxID=980116 RepID=A0A8H6I0B0_9AGAR|nr:hypothetical protein DFP72DRAFT_847309 [Tulosesus angulatus]
MNKTPPSVSPSFPRQMKGGEGTSTLRGTSSPLQETQAHANRIDDPQPNDHDPHSSTHRRPPRAPHGYLGARPPHPVPRLASRVGRCARPRCREGAYVVVPLPGAGKEVGEIPEGSYEMKVGDPEAEMDEEVERKAREEKDRRRRVRAKKEVEEVERRKGEEEEESNGEGDTARVSIPPQTSPGPTSWGRGDGNRGRIRRHRATSAVIPTPPPTLPSSPIPTSSSLTLSQCFLPPSSPYTSPPPRSAPSRPASPPPPPNLPRLTRASKRLYTRILECVPASDSVKPTPLDDGKCTLVELNPAEKKAKKRARVSTKPFRSRKSPKTTHPPSAASQSSHSSPALPRPSSRSSALRSRALADFDTYEPMPTAADLEGALHEGITFTPCLDISLAMLVDSTLAADLDLVTAPDGDTARATVAPARRWARLRRMWRHLLFLLCFVFGFTLVSDRSTQPSIVLVRLASGLVSSLANTALAAFYVSTCPGDTRCGGMGARLCTAR